ncbi:Aspartate 1-decarboxylase [Geodia barretti]|uniref:Aspartate 1-decarboxylase n=2 Tax=Geodia barretti TaxID=519541 RepID=A0AA35RLH7_GEOBA|nr:Aspartate 1-decarboxylase [Geodia barretti]
MRQLMRSKIHRATVTNCDEDYVGSIVIDQNLMDKSDIWEYEKVLVCDINNGSRFETYAIPGERGSGIISVQGAAAKLTNPGHKVIIMAFEVTEEPVKPKAVMVTETNEFAYYLTEIENAIAV